MRKIPLPSRAVTANPPNRFERVHRALDPGLEDEDAGTELIPDRSLSVVATNDSPDVPFDASINPYRGCEHGCVYCYARPTHEYLGFSSGLDFERKILVKHRAPQLLRSALSRPSWRPRLLGMSGVTDPYQPTERRLLLTRSCLEVLRDFRNPVSLVTKNHLVTRDLDLLVELAAHDCVHVTLSVTSLDRELQRRMEPRTSVPHRRLHAIETLAKAGVPVGVNVAPVIPGLNDNEIPAILNAAADAGATSAAFLLLRLPLGVSELFSEWLDRHYPDRKDRILNRIRGVRGGDLNDTRFFHRTRGAGPYAEGIRRLFRVSARKVGLDRPAPPLSTASFRRDGGVQADLFI